MRRLFVFLMLAGSLLMACGTTPTSQARITATKTEQPSATPTQTNTPTRTLTPTPTFTHTPTPTPTSTPSPTFTPTVTPVPTSALTPTSTPFPTIATDEFSEQTAMEALFGTDWVTYTTWLDEKEQRIRWKPSAPQELDRGFWDDWIPPGPGFWYDWVFSKLLFSASYRQNGVDKHLILIGTASPNIPYVEYGSYAIGGAVFSRVGDAWHIEASQVHFMWSQEWRHLGDKFDIVEIGPDRKGILITETWWGTGFGNDDIVLITYLDDEFQVILRLQDVRSWNNPCEDEEFPVACYEYNSVFEFLPGDNADFYDFKVKTSGTKHGESWDVAVPFEEVKTYTYSAEEQKYILTSRNEGRE